MGDLGLQREAFFGPLTSAVIEVIDDFVGDPGHVWRVAEYALVLGEQLKKDTGINGEINDRFLQLLGQAAPLHDIGKVCVDRRILIKPGRLTAEEFAAVKLHVTIGAQILKRAAEISHDAALLSIATDVVLYHHERFDGTGYCAGLRGTAIPLAARIVALADAFDALTSKRTYKEALRPEDAGQIIVAESGRQFDPVVVAAFQARFADFERMVAARPPNAAGQVI